MRLAHFQQRTVGRFERHQAGIARAVFDRYRHAEDTFDDFALMREKRFAGGADDAQGRQFQPVATRLGVRGQQRQTAGVAVDRLGVPARKRIKVGVHARGRHFEGVQQQLVDQPVAHGLDAIGFRQFDRCPPQIDLARARLDAPPAAGAQPAGRIRGLTRPAEIKDQWFAARSAGGVFEDAARHVAPDDTLDVLPRIAFVHDGQTAQIVERRRAGFHGRHQPGGADAFGMPGAVRQRSCEQRVQTRLPIGRHVLAPQPLGALQPGQHRPGGAMHRRFLRTEHAACEPGGHAH